MFWSHKYEHTGVNTHRPCSRFNYFKWRGPQCMIVQQQLTRNDQHIQCMVQQVSDVSIFPPTELQRQYSVSPTYLWTPEILQYTVMTSQNKKNSPEKAAYVWKWKSPAWMLWDLDRKNGGWRLPTFKTSGNTVRHHHIGCQTLFYSLGGLFSELCSVLACMNAVNQFLYRIWYISAAMWRVDIWNLSLSSSVVQNISKVKQTSTWCLIGFFGRLSGWCDAA